MSLPLTKILNPSDLEHEEMQFPLSLLEKTADKLHQAGVLDPLPVEWRKWEYAQGLRALLKAKANPRVLEVGGSSSLFLPTVVHAGFSNDITQLEEASWVSANAGRFWSQMDAVDAGGKLRCLTAEMPEGSRLFDFIACISVIENLPFSDGKENVVDVDPVTGAPWTTGHTFMQAFLEKLVDLLAPGGVLFITSDLKKAQFDDAHYHWMRPPGIWDPNSWWWLAHNLGDPVIGAKCDLLGGQDFTWTSHEISPGWGYTFASAAFRKL